MNDIDRRITTFLHDEAQRATLPAEMYQRVLRRAKIRRLVTATTAALAVVGVVLGGIVTAGALRTPQTRPPIQPAESPTPQDQHTGPKNVVAQGTIEGHTWTLVAYEGDNALCVDLEIASGSGGGCGFDVPGKRDLGLNVGSQRGVARTIIHGVVSKRVATVIVKLDSGKEVDVDVIESPNFNIDFFVAFLPPDAAGVIEARDDQRALLQKEPLRPLSEFRAQEAFTEDVLDDRKLVVYYPQGWDRALENLTPSLDQPTEVVSIGTGELIPGGRDCTQIPERAIEALGPANALMTLQEAGETANFPDRPKTFSAQDGQVPESSACLANADDILFRIFRFDDEGRAFLAYVAIGNSASAETRQQVWEIMNSFIICDPNSPPGDCL
jgi:hypothetical protein